MINILPIKLIAEEDQTTFGTSLFQLGLLQRAGLTPKAGFGVTAPYLQLDSVLSHYQNSQREVFEQSLTLIKKELTKIPVPEELSKYIDKKQKYLLQGKVYSADKLWLALMALWLDEIRLRLWTGGFDPSITKNLTAQAVFESEPTVRLAKAFFDPETKEVIIETAEREKIEPKQLKQIDEMVMQASKRLVIAQIFTLNLSEKIQIVDIQPFTQSVPAASQTQLVLPKSLQKQVVKTAVKVFLNLSHGFATVSQVDGTLIETDYLLDFDNCVFRLLEAALRYPLSPVIFKLPDDPNDPVRGAVRLISQASLFEKAASIFAFVKNKKDIHNIELCIPYLRSSTELLRVKRDLASLGLSRKGTLKVWAELSVPENFINLEGYTLAGIDGVLIDLDQLMINLGGITPQVGEFYKHELTALIKFLKPAFKELHKQQLPILVKGINILHPTILDFLLEAGVWGVVSNNLIEAESLPEHLSWAEKRFINKLPIF